MAYNTICIMKLTYSISSITISYAEMEKEAKEECHSHLVPPHTARRIILRRMQTCFHKYVRDKLCEEALMCRYCTLSYLLGQNKLRISEENAMSKKV